ncbi:MAG: hypothetical protein A3B14_00245 [Candidatus Zambryskibacteria bacterium RIFCSPLOWO2_01_FULL_45_21]|uniref:Uncharacterized protein n=1 Tax=Candidatus Zambryskibacteria bacterium RIFCSPLOWO2_01_FULL_45_21 TaxID=1802761 RepID=A0A1G2U2F7_9BACT|nr:MAG: hypothetical protein A3B14_00245 [Candidatus Zambryskibacteria bacterium RIFCSPLOWO2_01_FULL_45_21]
MRGFTMSSRVATPFLGFALSMFVTLILSMFVTACGGPAPIMSDAVGIPPVQDKSSRSGPVIPLNIIVVDDEETIRLAFEAIDEVETVSMADEVKLGPDGSFFLGVCLNFEHLGNLAKVLRYPDKVLEEHGADRPVVELEYQETANVLANSLLAVYEKPRDLRERVAPCQELGEGQFAFSSSMELMQNALDLLKIGNPEFLGYDAGELRRILRDDIKAEIAEDEAGQYGDVDSIVSEAVCNWYFTPEELGLKPEEFLATSCGGG